MMSKAIVAKPVLPLIPECIITDEFMLELKDAELHRTIIYRNKTGLECPVSFGRKVFAYPPQCEEFNLYIDNRSLNNDEWNANVKDYSQIIRITTPTIYLKNGEQLEVKIVTRWRDFYTFVNDFYYHFSYDEVAEYQLKFRNFSLANTLCVVKINDKEAVINENYNTTDNSVVINPLKLTPDEMAFSIKLFSLSTPVDLGILENQKGDKGTLFSDLCIIVIQHLLSDSFHLIDAFSHEGAIKDNIFIVGIPYSTKHQTVKYLREKGYANIYTPVKYPFSKEIIIVMEKAIELCEEGKTKKILVVEDGGYIVPLLHEKYIDKAGFFIGAVEQTANGIWRDQAIIDGGVDLQIPVINVAQSEIKLKLESPLIGRAVCKNIELIYNKSYRGIAGVEIGVIGYGSTGSHIAQTLRNMGANVMVYDAKAEKLEEAVTQQFKTGKSIVEVIKNSTIIVEATGALWGDTKEEMMEIILAFKHGSYFVSGSSKRMGLDYEVFKGLIYKTADKIINIPGVGVRYKIRNSDVCDLTLIADGYPVNFFLGESVPDRDIAFILAWLYKGAKILVENAINLPKVIIDTNEELDPWGLLAAQKIINKLHDSKMT